jgi:hypothetical protein
VCSGTCHDRVRGLADPGSGVVRAWVSGKGNDVSGCGAPTNACRTLQYAHDNIVAAGGEIDILDPAGYGAITITKSISIVNDDVGTAGVQSNSGNAINAPGASIYLRGLNLDGVQFGGVNGIEFKAGSALTLINCVARHFSGDGMLIDPAAGPVSVSISDSIFVENQGSGIVNQPTGGNATITAAIDHIKADNNGDNGISIEGTFAADSSAQFMISNSDASNNAQTGIGINSQNNNVNVEVNTSRMAYNGNDGLIVSNVATVHIAHSIMDYNHFVGILSHATAPGVLFSSGDNHAEGNLFSSLSGTAPTAETLH